MLTTRWTAWGWGAIACLAGPALAAAEPMPTRKEGLWEVTVRGETESVLRKQTVQQCTSKEAEPVMLLSVVPGQEHCHDVKVRRAQRGSYKIQTVCYVHDNRVDATVELSGDLKAHYSGAFEVKYAKRVRFEPGRTLFEGRWLGACRPGQRPGDMLLPNGATVNVVDDRKRAESHSHDGHSHP